jgi:diguanylate cyclase (GGDEF)-like protein
VTLMQPDGEAQERPSFNAPQDLLISRQAEGCVECFGCVRHCPARAIVMVAGVPTILAERCVECGVCVTSCGNAGYAVRDDLPAVRELLVGERPVVAVLASEYIAAMHPLSPPEVERALEGLGFAAVETTVLGEELVAAAYEQVKARTSDALLPRLRSTCPVAVSWVERFYPQLTDALVPIVPPYVAQARLVKAIYTEDVAVVYVSPCWARKNEIADPDFAGAVDVAIGFDELKNLLAEQPVHLVPARASSARARRPQAAKQLSLTDGFPRGVLLERDRTSQDLATVRGLHEIDRLLSGIMRGETAPQMVDMLSCEGCVDGPAIRTESSVFAKRNLIIADRERQPPPPVDSRSFLSAMPAIDLWRSFEPQPTFSRVPTVEEIDDVLAAGEFASRSAAIDCGACGYSTCVEHAAAICLGHSSWDMCFPLQRKRMDRERDELTRNALIDPITGLGNRRLFDQRLAEEVARSRRHEEPLTLIMIDLDRFKDINDRHGHVTGDAVLAAVGSLLRRSLRESDIAARYGGDEFSIILPATPKTEAWVVAEKLRGEMQELRVLDIDADDLVIRASLGVASYSGGHEGSVQLLEAADAALYRAKNSGRDRVELAAG